MRSGKLTTFACLMALAVLLPNILLLARAEMPRQLFDIKMELEDRLMQSSDELAAVIRYESFGSVPTPVDLTFTILDGSGNVIHSEKGDIVVETENIQRKKFRGLNLAEGKYTFVFKTVYNVDVSDEFRADFEIRAEKSSSLSWLWIIALILILIGLIFFIIYLIRRKNT